MILLTLILIVIVIALSIEVLVRGMPSRLANASRDNCYRLNGSWSKRRALRESAAKNQLRRELLAALIIVALAGGGWLAYVHNYVCEFPLAFRAISLMRLNGEEWKKELYRHDVEHDFQTWVRSTGSSSHQEATARKSALWNSWSTVPLLAIIWLFGGVLFVRTAYLRSLAQFEAGVKRRSEKYAHMEITRMAYKAELAERFQASAR